MRILVIAANGRTGQQVVRLAHSRGHQVTAFLRTGSKQTPDSSAQTIFGDATKSSDIHKAVVDIDSVISCIGHSRGSQSDVQTRTIHNIIEASKNTNRPIKIVSLTGTGVRQQDDRISFIDYVMNFAIRVIDPERVKDGIRHAEALQDNYSNWSVLRVLKLTNYKKSPAYSLTAFGPAKTFVGRRAAARALVELAESDKWTNKMPILSRGKSQ